MKRVLLFLMGLMILISCCNDNSGYSYEVKTPMQAGIVPSPQKKGFFEQAAENSKASSMELKDLNGRHAGSIHAYKGEYDGITWYVFIGSDGIAVVPAPVRWYYGKSK